VESDHPVPPELAHHPPAPTPLQYHSPDPAGTRQRTPGVIAICVLYGILAVSLFALGLLMFSIFAFGDPDFRRTIPAIVGLASTALFFGLGALLVRWMFKYIRSVGRPQR
jgi:hypothetical protein